MDRLNMLEQSKGYARVVVKTGRRGIDSFDYAPFNKTRFVGLDALLPNAYCNSALQVPIKYTTSAVLQFIGSIFYKALEKKCP